MTKCHHSIIGLLIAAIIITGGLIVFYPKFANQPVVLAAAPVYEVQPTDDDPWVAQTSGTSEALADA